MYRVLLADDEFSYAKRAIGVRATDYLLKPVSKEELTATMEEAIRQIQKQPKYHRLIDDNHIFEEEKQENIRLSAVADKIKVYIEQHYKDDIALQDKG